MTLLWGKAKMNGEMYVFCSIFVTLVTICHLRFWSWFNKSTAIICLWKVSNHWACWVNTSIHWRKVFSLKEGVKKIPLFWVPVLMTEQVPKFKRAVQDLLCLDKMTEVWIPVPKADSPWGKRRTKPKICCQEEVEVCYWVPSSTTSTSEERCLGGSKLCIGVHTSVIAAKKAYLT